MDGTGASDLAGAAWRLAPAKRCEDRGDQRNVARERLPGPKFLTVPKVFGSARNTPKPAKPETPYGRTLASANVMKR